MELFSFLDEIEFFFSLSSRYIDILSGNFLKLHVNHLICNDGTRGLIDTRIARTRFQLARIAEHSDTLVVAVKTPIVLDKRPKSATARESSHTFRVDHASGHNLKIGTTFLPFLIVRTDSVAAHGKRGIRLKIAATVRSSIECWHSVSINS